jgi:hypothetical protein
VAGECGPPAGRLQEGGQHVDRGRLAGPVGPEEAEDLPPADVEVDAAHGGEVAVLLHEALDLDDAIVFTP